MQFSQVSQVRIPQASGLNSWLKSSGLDTSLGSPTDDLVLCKYHIDDNWYRARVKNVMLDNSSNPPHLKAEVYYIDYGNVDFVPYNM